MKKFFKILAGLLLLTVLALAAFIYTFDANKYKQEIAGVIEAAIGRPVVLGGDVELSLYPWLGIKLNDVAIENKPGFSAKNFATIGQFDIRVEIVPLLQKRLEIDKLVMHRLAVELEKNPAGENNWEDFAGGADGESASANYGLAALVVNGVELADASLSWLDAASNKQFKLSKASIVTGAVVKGQPLPVEIKAYMESNQPAWLAALNVKADLEFSDNSPTFNANNLKLSAKALLPGKDRDKISFTMVSDSVINWQDSTAKLSKTRFSIYGLILGGNFEVENIFSVPTIQGPMQVKKFAAADLAKQLNIDFPAMANTQSLKNIALKTTFKTDFDTVYLDDIYAQIDSSRIRGYVHITDTSRSHIQYALQADSIALHDYKPVSSKAGEDETMLPLDYIATANLEGTFDVDKMAVDDIELTDLHITSQIKDGVLNINPVTLWQGDSEIKAAVQLDARSSPRGKLVFNAKNVDANAVINPLLKTIKGDDALTVNGLVDIDVNINSTGASFSEHKSSAKGTLKVEMNKAIIKGIDLEHTSRTIVADYANKNNFRTRQAFISKYEPDRDTEFDNLKAIFNVANGKLTNSDLSLVSDTASITGSGSIDLINEKLDYRPVIDIKVVDRIDIRDKLRDHPMEYHIHGPFKSLAYKFEAEKYDLLVSRMLVQESKARINRQINTGR